MLQKEFYPSRLRWRDKVGSYRAEGGKHRHQKIITPNQQGDATKKDGHFGAVVQKMEGMVGGTLSKRNARP